MYLEGDSVINALVLNEPTPVMVRKTRKGSVIGMPTEGPSAEELLRTNEELEQRVREYAAKAEAATKELEGFCYSVSHDLRAPLRSIDGFTHALIESASDKIEPVEREYLQRVRAASQRMGKLIDDLLHLSRVGRREMRVQDVNLSDVAVAVSRELQASDAERHVDFIIAPEMPRQPARQRLEVHEQNSARAHRVCARTEGRHRGVLRARQRRGLRHDLR
jgi:light-regulated signal transduction histidine kinase (bacteriophytochrome)